MYADYLVLLSPSATGLSELLLICEELVFAETKQWLMLLCLYLL